MGDDLSEQLASPIQIAGGFPAIHVIPVELSELIAEVHIVHDGVAFIA